MYNTFRDIISWLQIAESRKNDKKIGKTNNKWHEPTRIDNFQVSKKKTHKSNREMTKSVDTIMTKVHIIVKRNNRR